MAINGDYANPVTVNGYSCKNCTDVDLAKKHVDPAHPKDGPYGVNAPKKPTVTPSALDQTRSVVNDGGALAGLIVPSVSTPTVDRGARLDISV